MSDFIIACDFSQCRHVGWEGIELWRGLKRTATLFANDSIVIIAQYLRIVIPFHHFVMYIYVLYIGMWCVFKPRESFQYPGGRKFFIQLITTIHRGFIYRLESFHSTYVHASLDRGVYGITLRRISSLICNPGELQELKSCIYIFKSLLHAWNECVYKWI